MVSNDLAIAVAILAYKFKCSMASSPRESMWKPGTNSAMCKPRTHCSINSFAPQYPRRSSFWVAQLRWPMKLLGPCWNPGEEPKSAFWPWISLLFDLWISSDYRDSWSPAVSHSTPFTKTAHIIWVKIFFEQLRTLQESGWKYGLNKVKLPESEFHIYHWAVTIYKAHFSNP